MQEENLTVDSKINKKGKGKIIALFVFIMIIFAGSVYGYFYYNNVILPKIVISKMFDKMGDIRSFSYEGKFIGEFDSKEMSKDSNQSFLDIGKSNFLLNFKGISDLNSSKNLVYFDLETNILMGINLFMKIDVINSDKVAYFKIKDISNIGFIDLGKIKEKWIKIDIEDKFVEDNIKEEYLSREKIFKEIEESFLSGRLFEIEGKIKETELEGKKIYIYNFLLNKEEIRRLITSLLKEELIKEDDLEIEEGLNILSYYGGEIWVGKEDFLPYNFSFKNIKEIPDFPSSNFDFTLHLKDFNSVSNIDFPSDYKKIEEILIELFGNILNND